jgi:2-hydroxy-3-oxopropionate reductase
MGRPMAANIRDFVSAGAIACKSAKALAEQAEVIIIMVPDTPQVSEVLFGSGGVAEGISKGKIVVDMSSISPLATKEFAKKISDLGGEYLDAPVSGGEVGAKAASLTIMVGGSQKSFDAVKPLFDKLGKNVTSLAETGTARPPRWPIRSSSRSR